MTPRPSGDDLGLQNELNGSAPMKTLGSGERTVEDYTFVHTDSHKEFMDLLLEKRKQLETLVSNKQREKRIKGEVPKVEEKTEEIPSSEGRYHLNVCKS